MFRSRCFCGFPSGRCLCSLATLAAYLCATLGLPLGRREPSDIRLPVQRTIKSRRPVLLRQETRRAGRSRPEKLLRKGFAVLVLLEETSRQKLLPQQAHSNALPDGQSEQGACPMRDRRILLPEILKGRPTCSFRIAARDGLPLHRQTARPNGLECRSPFDRRNRELRGGNNWPAIAFRSRLAVLQSAIACRKLLLRKSPPPEFLPGVSGGFVPLGTVRIFGILRTGQSITAVFSVPSPYPLPQGRGNM